MGGNDFEGRGDAAGTGVTRRAAARLFGGGLAAVLGPAGADAAKRRRKRRKPAPAAASRVVFGPASAPLPAATASEVSAEADCGGPGRVLGGGYQINATDAGLLNAVVATMGPDPTAARYRVVLHRTTGAGSTAGATVNAFAICRA